jgi:branched-subunit amino acid aminotransferase/4-amino-4-deoxychorismate lyase
MQANRIEPTPEMLAFYERRTNEHIERVRRCLIFLAGATDYGEELIERAKAHDVSKFGDEERIPYVWLTEYHRCKRSGEAFDYPEGMTDQVKRAIRHHVTTNRHHPEFHADPNDMSEVDLIEMVCDWTAMAQEFGQDGGSARGWADKTIGNRVAFNANKRRFIYQMIDELDRQIAANP